VERDGKSLLEWIRIHSLRGLPGLAGPELGFSRTSTASVLRNDACLRLPARNTTILNNTAAMHEFTGVDPYNQQAQEKSHLFTFYSRYDANTFQDIMPDTGAAGVSTAGEPQVRALQKRFPKVTVDTSTTGQHKISFDNNPEILSLEAINVKTFFGNVYFAVMPTNTSFLFCLANMNSHDVYLNNINNILVYNSKKNPIVRKWEHL
jgi:hypothetical protein